MDLILIQLNFLPLKDWLTQTIPKKSPYFPQINDEVVYIPFGHKLYNEEVKRRRLYKITKTNTYIKTHFDTKVIAKVVQIKFVIESNIRLVILTLREIDPKTNISINKQFNVRYHDMENVIDFIVLRKCYESSYSTTKWKPGDQFRAIVEDKWWFGTIKGYNLNNELAKNTFFQLYWIEWANNQTELLSIWDLDKINGIVPKNRRHSVDITDEEREQFYTSGANEWPLCGKLEECERIAEGLVSLKINLFFNYFFYICFKVFFQSFHLFDYRFGYNNEVQRVRKVCISSRFGQKSILCAKNCLSVELNYY